MLLVTHDGKFHADEVLAAAILLIATGETGVTRTRDPKVIENADIAFDVGFGRYDHHQKGGNGKRSFEPFIPYSSAGLIWRDFGIQYIQNVLKELGQSLRWEEILHIYEFIDKSIVSEVDLVDNGLLKGKDLSPTSFSVTVAAMNPSWFETEAFVNEAAVTVFEKMRFHQAIGLGDSILRMAIRGQLGIYLAQTRLKADMDMCGDGEVLVLSGGFYPWQNQLDKEDHGFKMVVFGSGESWKVQTVQTWKDGERKTICYLPQEWAGLNGGELEEVSGIQGAVFCHNGRFIAGTTSRISAIDMALKAIQIDKGMPTVSLLMDPSCRLAAAKLMDVETPCNEDVYKVQPTNAPETL